MKRAFSLSLEVLAGYGRRGLNEGEFLRKLSEKECYLNQFLRSEEELFNYGLIGYKMDGNFQKEVFITKRGEKLLGNLEEINELLSDGNS